MCPTVLEGAIGARAYALDMRRRATLGLVFTLLTRALSAQPTPPATPTLVVQLGHSGPLTAAEYSPDGRFILTAGMDAEAVLWHAATGRELRRLRDNGPVTFCAVFSPDSKVAAVCGGFEVRIWDFESDVVRHRIKAFGAENAAFSPDGTTLLTGGFRPALWDVATGDELQPLEGHEGKVTVVAYFPDGGRIATGGEDGSIRFWEPATGREIGSLPGHEGGVSDLAFTPDGSRLASSGSSEE